MPKGSVELRALATSLLLAFTLAPVTSAGQGSADNLAARGPRFLFASNGSIESARPIDAARVVKLQRRIAVDLDGVTIESALQTISDKAGLKLAYRATPSMALDRVVHLRASEITVASALTSVLLDANVDIVFSPTGQAILVPRARTEELIGTIMGRVTDAASNESASGVTVEVEGTTMVVTTGADGLYRFPNAPAGSYTVTARRLGYAKLSRLVTVLDGQEARVDFALTRVASRLEEVVTTATGDQRRLEVGNAIGSVQADSVMRSAPVNNINDMLSGRVAGVQVYNAGGYTGTTAPIRIRGTNSFTVSNDPIIIVDGVRIENSTGINPPASGGGTALRFIRQGGMADLSMFEIESIDVVKGPSATTLYGSDAANGVIVIHTKRGAAGAPRWQLWTDQGTLQPVDHFRPAYWGYGTNLTSGAAQKCLLVQVAAQICRQDSLATSNVLEDPVTSPIATGYRNVYGAQVSGGADRFTYFLSGEKSSETGYLRMPDAEQDRIKALRGVSSLPDEQIRPNYAHVVNLRANVGASLGDKAHLQLSNGLVFNTTAIPGAAIYSSGAFLGSAPTPQGSWFGDRPGESFAATSSNAASRHTTSLAGDYQPSSWLSTRATVGIDASSEIQNALQKNGEGPISTAAGQRQDNRFDIRLWSADLSATASTSLRPGLTSRTTIGGQYNRRREFDLFATGLTLAPGSQTLAGAATRTTDENTTETIVAGTFMEQTFGLGDRLFLTGALRLDGGSAFGSAFSTAAYPKASVSWLATDGSRGGWPGWVDNLRLRAAYGSSGVQPSAVAALQRDCLVSALVNGVGVTGASLCQLGNAKLKPETQTEYEGGLDAGLLNSRVTVELTYYRRQSRDAISALPLPPSATAGNSDYLTSGLTIPVNLGSVRNAGFEGLVNVRVLEGKATTLDVGLNGNVNRNRLLALGAGVPFTPTSANQPGYPLNSQFFRGYTYSDADGNGLITANEVTVAATPSYLGPKRPTTQLSGTAALGLFRGAVRLSAMADYRTGSTILNVSEIQNCFFGTCRGLADPHASLADQAAAQAALKGGYTGFASSGRFLAVRELSASYTIPQRAAGVLRARGAQLSLSGRNLGYFMREFEGFSVESTQAIPSDGLGPQNPGPPMARYWILRLTLDY